MNSCSIQPGIHSNPAFHPSIPSVLHSILLIFHFHPQTPQNKQKAIQHPSHRRQGL